MAQGSSGPGGSLWNDMTTGLANAGAYLGQFGNPSIRLGVTGLSRAGKTVFITGLVHALVSRAPLPAFKVSGEGRLAQVRLVPHADDAVPRFAYEDHIAALQGPEREWPQSTRQISALRLELEFQSRRAWLGGLLGPGGMIGGGASTLSLDIVDYPGEWLLDLPLLDTDYATWSATTLAKAGIGTRAAAFAPYLAMLPGFDFGAEAVEADARKLAEVFTAGLRACRAEGIGLSALAPGRFLMPGDLEGAPALAFAPLPAREGGFPAGSLGALMVRRYEAYKAKVVRPFFTDHFARLDRQVVLVDVLGALNAGPEALADLESALADVLLAFRVGENSLLSSLFSPRIGRILFAATKADHLHHTNHARLEAILALLVRRAFHRARGAGAETATLALASIRATREVTTEDRGTVLRCVAGVPLKGEVLDGHVFDGETEVALFPGDLPEDAAKAFAGVRAPLRFLRFRPPVMTQGGASLRAELPQVRLDKALEFLLGDKMT